jgi:hypothetical protein
MTLLGGLVGSHEGTLTRVRANVLAVTGDHFVGASTARNCCGCFDERAGLFCQHPVNLGLCGSAARPEHHKPKADHGLRLHGEHG